MRPSLQTARPTAERIKQLEGTEEDRTSTAYETESLGENWL
jgi:hypothetical protein